MDIDGRAATGDWSWKRGGVGGYDGAPAGDRGRPCAAGRGAGRQNLAGAVAPSLHPGDAGARERAAAPDPARARSIRRDGARAVDTRPWNAGPLDGRAARDRRARPARAPRRRGAGDNLPEARAADALYRQAHELHFVHRDFAAALAAWDRYLAADPRPLALEGRWNRAIALVHLERREEAIAALQPFADAAAGSYRQHEARALIDKLQRED